MSDHAIFEQSQRGLALIENAIETLLKTNMNGLTNTEIARMLGLESSHNGKQANYLTYSVLGLLMYKGKDQKNKVGKIVLYKYKHP